MTGLEPLVIPALIGSAAAGSVAAIQSGRAASKSARANAEFNAAVARDEAARKAEAGRIEAERARRDAARLRATQEVGFAKAGVTTEGTPIDVMIRSAADEELNALQLQHGYNIGQARSLSEAGLQDFRKGQAKGFERAGYLSAGTSLLRGIADVGKYKARKDQ
jgi:hypothetical protein